MFRFIRQAIHRSRCHHDLVETGTTEHLVNEGAGVYLETWVHLTCVDCAKRIERPEVLHRGGTTR